MLDISITTTDTALLFVLSLLKILDLFAYKCNYLFIYSLFEICWALIFICL